MNLSIQSRFVINPNDPLFDGHFPGQPTFPGVGIIDVSMRQIQKHLQVATLDLASIKSTKFMDIIGPHDEVEFYATSEDSVEWHVDWKKAGKPVVKLHLFLVRAGAN